MEKSIVLVNGQFGKPRIIEPLSILALSAYLKERNFNVELYDIQMYPEIDDHAINILTLNPKFIGISILAYQYRKLAMNLVLNLRQHGYTGFICIGGQDPSVDWQEYLYPDSGVDVIVIGEGEVTLTEILRALETNEDWRQIHGIAYMNEEGEIIRTDPRELSIVDELPFLDRTVLLKQLSKWGKDIVSHASILTSRGCYACCSFCSIMAYYDVQLGSRFRLRSIESIISEMEHVHQITGITSFSFDDDNFLLPGRKGDARVIEFCEAIEGLAFKIESLRIDTRVTDLNEKKVAMLKQAGLKRIIMGIESFLDADLLLYEKGVTQEIVIQTLDMLEKQGFSAAPGSLYHIMPGTIVFNPYTSMDGLLEQLKFFRRYRIPPKKLGTKLIIYPHTKMYNKLYRENLLKPQGAFKFLHPKVEQIYENYRKGLDKVIPIRDRVRFLEKLTTDAGRALALPNLEQWRIEIDDSCYSLFETLILAELNNDNSSVAIDSWWREIRETMPVDEVEFFIRQAENKLPMNNLDQYLLFNISALQKK
jgi:radical SAM superfamily enzyme YgiQ (UPF0313 family)